jgi:hypothetical protein
VEKNTRTETALCNIKEAYIKYKEAHPDIAVTFSECSVLLETPKQCFLFGAYGTHITCMCTIHQSMKLMMQVIDRCS